MSEARIELEGPLGAAAAVIATARAAQVQIEGPLGSARGAVWVDWTGRIDPTAVTYYACDIEADDLPPLRVPISSWQATRQIERAQYLQAVIPAAGAYLEAIAERAQAQFVIRRGARLANGETHEVELARAAIGSARLDEGPNNRTLTLSGYAPGDAAPADTGPGDGDDGAAIAGLVHYWPLDESAGQPADQITGAAAQMVGDPGGTTVAQGLFGAGRNFGATPTARSHMRLWTTSAPVTRSQWTLACWFRRDNTSSPPFWPVLWSMGNASGVPTLYTLTNMAGTAIIIDLYAADGDWIDDIYITVPPLWGTGWHHVVIANSGPVMQLYLDGQMLGSLTGMAITTGIDSSFFGSSSGTNSHNDMLVDDLAIIDRQISPEEVLELWNDGDGRPAIISGSGSTPVSRTLQGVRSQSSGEGARVRAAVDWWLRPGQTVISRDQLIRADWLNYYVSASDAYMDIGERNG
jgi:hypothetical protein